MKTTNTTTSSDRVENSYPSSIGIMEEADGVTETVVTDDRHSLVEAERLREEQPKAEEEEEEEEKISEELQLEHEEETKEEKESLVEKKCNQRDDAVKSELKSSEEEAKPVQNREAANDSSSFHSQPGAVAMPGLSQDSSTEPIRRSKLPFLGEPDASTAQRSSLGASSMHPQASSMPTLRQPSVRSVHQQPSRRSRESARSIVPQSSQLTEPDLPSFADDQSGSTFAAYTPRRSATALSLGGGTFASSPHSEASSSASSDEAENLEDGTRSVPTTDDDTFAPRRNHLYSHDMGESTNYGPSSSNGDNNTVLVLAATLVHDNDDDEPHEMPMAHAKKAWSRRTLLAVVLALVMIVTAPLVILWALRGPHHHKSAASTNTTTVLEGFCNWGFDGTAETSVCEGGAQGGDFCNSERGHCLEDCGGRWCAPCELKTDGEWCPQPLPERKKEEIDMNTTNTNTTTIITNPEGSCNWGIEGTAESSTCEGGAQGGSFCNENRGHCQDTCGGKWCMNDLNGTMAPTPAPAAKPAGFCDWGPDGTAATSVCANQENGSVWCSESANNCEQHCSGHWCTELAV